MNILAGPHDRAPQRAAVLERPSMRLDRRLTAYQARVEAGDP